MANGSVEALYGITPAERACPSISPSVRLAVIDGGCIAFDKTKDKVHCLNTTAALILTLCDGSHTVQDIKDAVSCYLGDDAESARSVDAWLEQAVRDGQILWQADGPAPHVEMNAAELAELADLLHNEGCPTDAYRCRKRATELDPDDSQLWYHLGEDAQINGDRSAAQQAYERYLELEPEDPEVRQILCALRSDPAPTRASNEYVRHIFDSFADHYDENMRDELEYRAPELMLDRLDRLLPAPQCELDVADLGCGTGLVGPLLRPWARRLAGIDLSHDMVAEAVKRKVYDSFHLAELTDWLRSDQATYDLMVACDVFIYFGDLTSLLAGARGRLAPGGLLAFTVEKGDRDVSLTDSGRYAHSRQHIREAIRRAGLELVDLTEHVLRHEYGLPVIGLFAIASLK